MSDAVDVLGRLRKKAIEERASVQDRINKGVGRREYNQGVGQLKALSKVLDQIQTEIRAINGGDDGEG